MGESGKGNGKVKVGDNVLPVNLLPYLDEACLGVSQRENVKQTSHGSWLVPLRKDFTHITMTSSFPSLT
jgi:hypothetical protein